MKIRTIVCVALLLAATHVFAGDRDAAMVMVANAEKNLNAGQFDVAKGMCERALAEDKNCPEAQFLLGCCFQKLGKAKEAMASYQLAADLAKKGSNSALMAKALDAAKNLVPGLPDILTADQKLAAKLTPLANAAMDGQQWETARFAYQAILAVAPANENAKKNLADVEQQILARGDPIKAKIASAALAESFYYVGVSQLDKAREMAEKARSHADTAAGKEADHLLACNFDLSQTIGDDLATAKKEFRQIIAKSTPVAPTTASAINAPATGIDIDAVEKTATDESKKMPKEKLVPSFTETYAKGKDFYSKAAPGTDGNQKNVAAALEQFIRCEVLYLRIDEEKIMTPDVEESEKQASMLRYACMKMTILSH